MIGVIGADQSSVVKTARKTTSLIEAKETIANFDVVTMTGYKGDSTNVLHKNIIAGIAQSGAATGYNAHVVTSGEITNSSWTWSAGNVIYLNGTSLSVTPPSSGFRVIIGEAVSATKIIVNISESILF